MASTATTSCTVTAHPRIVAQREAEGRCPGCGQTHEPAAEWAPPADVHLVAYRYDRLNVSITRVYPLADGMERVEWIGRDHAGRAAAEALLEQAEGLAKATGSKQVTHTDDRSLVGGRKVSLTFYAGGRYSAPRRSLSGVHRAPVSADPAQAALAARVTSTRELWAEGQRVVVGQLTGYQLVQNRPLEHRDCTCGDGTTTYVEGTVTAVQHFMDNSVEARVALDNGTATTVTLVAPHGDACF